MFDETTVRNELAEAGCGEAQIEEGLAYAREKGASDTREAFQLAMSRILYDDGQLADGALFGVE